MGCSNCDLFYLPTWDVRLSCGSVYFKTVLEVFLGPELDDNTPYDRGNFVTCNMGDYNFLLLGTPILLHRKITWGIGIQVFQDVE